MQALPVNNSYLPEVAVLGWQESPPESEHLMVPSIQEAQTSHPDQTPPYSVVVPLLYGFRSQETVTTVCENLRRILHWTTNKQHPAGHSGALTALRTPMAVVIQILP